MPLARYQFTVTDEAGNVLPNASVEVRREATGAPIVSLYTDREGVTPLGNPFNADSDGFAAFHVAGGAYRVTASLGGFSRTWRYVGIGLASERDGFEAFSPRGAWSAVVTYDQADLVEHEGFAFLSNDDGNINHEPTTTGSPPEPASDAFWTFVNAASGVDGEPGSSDVTGASNTSLAIGTGSKAFTIVEQNRGWAVGARLRAASAANPSVNYMEGVVTAYDGVTLTLTVDVTGGSGTLADWIINLAGERGTTGATGATGNTGAQGGTGPQGPVGPSIVSLLVFLTGEDVVVGNAAGGVAWRVPNDLHGYELTEIGASVFSAGTTGNLDIQVRNATQAEDMLSTAMRIETGEVSTQTSAQPGTINEANAVVAQGDLIVIDVDSVQTTPPNGLVVDLKFEVAA